MMNKDVWKSIIGNVFLLCGIRPMDDKNHAMYIACMYAELKDKFTNEEIGLAARQIAENENLYGNYPPLSVWLKYCPSRRAAQREKQTELSDFLSEVRYVWTASVVDNFVDIENDWISRYGNRCVAVLRHFDGVYGLRRDGFHGSPASRERFVQEIRRIWDETQIDETVGTLRLTGGDNKKMLGKIDGIVKTESSIIES